MELVRVKTVCLLLKPGFLTSGNMVFLEKDPTQRSPLPLFAVGSQRRSRDGRLGRDFPEETGCQGDPHTRRVLIHSQ